jgi:16S rRNA (cytosine967-C5)-methyltransferase
MPVSPARAAAFEILLRVERQQSYASELLHAAPAAKLSSRDHGLATELVMGVLRWQSLLDEQIEGTSRQRLKRLDPEVLLSLRLATYQLLFSSRIPSRAAIFESVELVKTARKSSAAPFVNAVLRRFGGAGPRDFLAEIKECSGTNALSKASAHPAWLVSRWVRHYGFDATRQICLYDQATPSTAIHIHDRNTEHEILGEQILLEPGQLVSGARKIVSGNIAATRAFRERRVFIQDEASQLVALLVGQGRRILDCCAAPGSKTSFMAARNPEAVVIASELHAHRARLMRGLARQPNVRIVAADARHLPFHPGFDRVLADVPCSGTGTLARNPEIKWRLTAEDLGDLQLRQIAILRSALAQLAPGGRMVYSTCSLEPEENQAVVEAALAEHAECTIVDCRGELRRLQQTGELSWNQLESLLSGPYLTTLPGVHPCDGFFAAVIERKSQC